MEEAVALGRLPHMDRNEPPTTPDTPPDPSSRPRSSRQRPHAVSSHARHSSHPSPRFGAPAASASPSMSDNHLRRKTPGGTIDGAFHSSLRPHVPTYERFHAMQSTPPQYPAYDSMTFQNPAHPFQYVNPLSQNAATVIQYPSQPFGPTASGSEGNGPFGPYWHDGTFVPYRAHAIRDPRYYPNSFGHLQQQHDSHAMPQYPTRWTYSAPFNQGHIDVHNALYIPPFTNPISETDAANAVASDRERIFTLALATYRELLPYLVQLRQQSISAPTNQPLGRSTIFPRPPSSSNGHTHLERTQASLPHSPPRPESRWQDPIPNQIARSHVPQSSTNAADFNTLRNEQQGVMSHRSPPHSTPAWPQSTGIPNGANHLLRRSSSSLVTPQSPPQNNIILRSTNALTSLKLLCNATDWQWIDGLHLGGCLSYGLGEFSQALDLYAQVLRLDPDHVEAAANLAAALLALGRDSEAERHWSRVVKQAPSYFEAVEHLVGLLSTSNRAREAVKVIEHVERSLRLASAGIDQTGDNAPVASRLSGTAGQSEHMTFDHDSGADAYTAGLRKDSGPSEPGFASSGYAIPGCDNGRILALVHAKGNMLYAQGDNTGAARAFEDVVLIATNRRYRNIQEVISHVVRVIAPGSNRSNSEPVLLHPEQAIKIASLCFPPSGDLPGLVWLPSDPNSLSRRGAILTTSNSLLSLAKIFQDGMAVNTRNTQISQMVSGVREILALYYLSLSLQPSPSTANNVGILLAGVQHSSVPIDESSTLSSVQRKIPGVIPGSGVALALAYYNFGLNLDSGHAHLYTNLGSLLKDIGQLDAAIEMYKKAVHCDPNFDIALANLANAVKDKGRTSEAIDYYHRAVKVSPNFAEAVCGLANALNSICKWTSRGGIANNKAVTDRWHVGDDGMLADASLPGVKSSGWVKGVVGIVQKQLAEGDDWGCGCLTPPVIDSLVARSVTIKGSQNPEFGRVLWEALQSWAGQRHEGARLTRLVERLTKRITWQWYQDKYVCGKEQPLAAYKRPQLPPSLRIPAAPTLLPFHTFTSPMSARQVRLISQRNGFRSSASALKAAWLSPVVHPPPAPPSPVLKVGYVSSDFNNHPLAHLMQSVFGMHDRSRVDAFCYATTASDGSPHRRQIESEVAHFIDASSWSTEQLVSRIVSDGIHILVNFNGYTRGARNDVFAARPAPIHMSFMGFAGTLGAEWCDYLLADSTSIPTSTLRPWRRNVDVGDQLVDGNSGDDGEDWLYGENIIYCRSTFFCCDHRQSAPDSASPRLTWRVEQSARWEMRRALFPSLAPETVILANFNQLYKIEPTTFRSWLRILARVPNAVLWLLRFPDLGEANLKRTAHLWAGADVASRVLFTDVAPKQAHIARAKIVDLFLDTPECNAHTTAADVLWSGTPLLTLPRYPHKMCSRMAASILRGALPRDGAVRRAMEADLIAGGEDEYEDRAVALAAELRYAADGRGEGKLMELRRILTEARWSSDLFDTGRWTRDLEDAYEEAWRRWVVGEGGDIWLDELPVGGAKGAARKG